MLDDVRHLQRKRLRPKENAPFSGGSRVVCLNRCRLDTKTTTWHLLLGSVVADGITSDDEREHVVLVGQELRASRGLCHWSAQKPRLDLGFDRSGEWHDSSGTHRVDVGSVAWEHRAEVETVAIRSKERLDLTAEVLPVGD